MDYRTKGYKEFMWPDQETLDYMPVDNFVTKMIFKQDSTSTINSVQFFYSDGSHSPVFKASEGGGRLDKFRFMQEQTLVLD